MAINGNGYFVVSQPTGTADNQPVFSGVSDYTRAGDFQLNSGGYLVNSAGYYLQGIPIDAATGNPVGSSPQVLQFNNDFIPAQATTAIQYQANLPSTPSSGLLVGTDFEANPLAGAPAAAVVTGKGANSATGCDRDTDRQRQSYHRDNARLAWNKHGRSDQHQRWHQYANGVHRAGGSPGADGERSDLRHQCSKRR